MKKAFIWIALPVLALVLWFITHTMIPKLEVVHATRGPAVQAVYATGTVEASVMMPIAARGAARLMELNVDEGSNVTKGQVLARLEDTDLQNSLEELQAQENYAKGEYDRKTALVKRGYASKESSDRARTDWESARAAVARATAQADFMKLMSPADGRIIRRDGEIGQLIPANQPVFWMSCCAPLRITTEVDEEDIALVQPGQEVLIRADAFPGQVFHGKVQSITPKGDPVARSYRVRVEFAEDTPLLIGMTAETNIITQQSQDVLLVPASAVMQNKVWVVKNGKLEERAIVTGAKSTDEVEVKSGLTAEEDVVLRPIAGLEAGQGVRTRIVDQVKK